MSVFSAKCLINWALQTDMECEEGKVRLVGGVTNSSGRLEVCANGVWGRVCNYLRYWGPDNARVVCRQLRFSEQGIKDSCNTMCTSHHRDTLSIYVLGASVLSASVFGASSRPFILGEVHCTGSETELLECSHNSIGDHLCGADAEDVAIGCGMFPSLHHPHKCTHTHTHTHTHTQQYYCC